jgi:hypothetical protein
MIPGRHFSKGKIDAPSFIKGCLLHSKKVVEGHGWDVNEMKTAKWQIHNHDCSSGGREQTGCTRKVLQGCPTSTGEGRVEDPNRSQLLCMTLIWVTRPLALICNLRQNFACCAVVGPKNTQAIKHGMVHYKLVKCGGNSCSVGHTILPRAIACHRVRETRKETYM